MTLRSPLPSPRGLLHVRTQNIENNPMHSRMGLNSHHFSPPPEQARDQPPQQKPIRTLLSFRTLRIKQSKPIVADASIPTAMLEIGGNEILRSSASTSSYRQLEYFCRASSPP